jgi:hypothetical protein
MSATRRKLASVLVLLCVVGVGPAGERDIVERLRGMGANVSPSDICFDEKDGLTVLFDGRSNPAGLALLCELPRLRVVVVFQDVTEAEMRPIGSLAWLRVLCLSGSSASDAHLKQVGHLRRLKALSLRGKHVTDAGLEELTGLVDLKTLHLDGTAVTDAGVSRLQKSLPNCEIIR